MDARTRKRLVAPCGMDCALCLAYLRRKDHCPGCRVDDEGKRASLLQCTIKNCPEVGGRKARFCGSCDGFPCKRLRQLDRRYRRKYHMSMMDNLAEIAASGIDAFLKNQTARWTCTACGGTICVHRGACAACGQRYF